MKNQIKLSDLSKETQAAVRKELGSPHTYIRGFTQTGTPKGLQSRIIKTLGSNLITDFLGTWIELIDTFTPMLTDYKVSYEIRKDYGFANRFQTKQASLREILDIRFNTESFNTKEKILRKILKMKLPEVPEGMKLSVGHSYLHPNYTELATVYLAISC